MRTFNTSTLPQQTLPPRLACSTLARCRPAARCLAQQPCAVSATPGPSGLATFADGSLTSFSLAVLGDLHLAPDQMPLFHGAREHLRQAMSDADGHLPAGARIVQLGDLGNSKHKPGSRQCFQAAREYLHSYGVPSALVLGNHDLEGVDFDSDEDNLAAWTDVFGHAHHWCLPLGPAVIIGLSTTRFRSNVSSHHEVYIDEDQMAWVEERLVEHAGRPVIIFTHAPPMGCGLKVLQEVHVKNRCAWLNHSDRPRRFMDLVARHPNIRLWFSGHFHLSHNYRDSISAVGSTAFVQTGVIGACNRDGNRQSRLVKGDGSGYQVFTVDHDTGTTRLDLQQGWWDSGVPVPVTPEEELLCDPSAGWLCSPQDCNLDEAGGGFVDPVLWFPAGRESLLAHQGDLLVEYDMVCAAPVGLVARLTPESTVRLLNEAGSSCSADDGSDAVTVEVFDPDTGDTRHFPRNKAGGFYQIFQPNKWRLNKIKLRQEAEALAAALPTLA